MLLAMTLVTMYVFGNFLPRICSVMILVAPVSWHCLHMLIECFECLVGVPCSFLAVSSVSSSDSVDSSANCVKPIALAIVEVVEY